MGLFCGREGNGGGDDFVGGVVDEGGVPMWDDGEWAGHEKFGAIAVEVVGVVGEEGDVDGDGVGVFDGAIVNLVEDVQGVCAGGDFVLMIGGVLEGKAEGEFGDDGRAAVDGVDEDVVGFADGGGGGGGLDLLAGEGFEGLGGGAGGEKKERGEKDGATAGKHDVGSFE